MTPADHLRAARRQLIREDPRGRHRAVVVRLLEVEMLLRTASEDRELTAVKRDPC